MPQPETATTVASIVIPAHNEELSLGRLLTRILENAAAHEFEIIVVCNGCTDGTADVAARFAPEVRVVNIPQPSKFQALQVGDREARTFPRLYVDADVELAASDVRALAEELQSGKVLACAPDRHLSRRGVSVPVKWYYDIWEQLPQVEAGLFGRGVVAVSRSGHQRLADLPSILPDDLAISETFTPTERTIVRAARVTVHPARTISSLVKRRIRVAAGNVQAERYGLRRPETQTSPSILLQIGRRSRLNWVKLAAFLGVAVASRFLSRKQIRSSDFESWSRDESSREPLITRCSSRAPQPEGVDDRLGASAQASRHEALDDRPHVLIIVQNLPVPMDRRVWLECQALVKDGYDVSVICPKGPTDPSYQVIEGVHLYKYRPPPEAQGLSGYAREFIYCWIRTALLTVRVWRRRRFDALQACNPPDTFWALGRLWRLAGVRFVFDHHDLNPEVYLSRFGPPSSASSRLQMAGLRWLERQTFRTADRVISTNESYRQIALERGGVAPEHTAVVRSGPDTSRMRPIQSVPALRLGGDHLLVYLGIMGPQDGVEGILQIADRIIRKHGRTDVRIALLGFGDCLNDLKSQCTAMGLDSFVEFAGRAGPEMITNYLSTASVGLSPDPLSPLNDVSTMNKTMEYMSYALPVVAYRLKETVVSGGDAALYIAPGDIDAFATAVVDLLNDDNRRGELGLRARRRAEQVLDWRAQAQIYTHVYDGLLTSRTQAEAGGTLPTAPSVPSSDVSKRAADDLIDVSDDELLRRFAATRSCDSWAEVDR